MNELALGYVCVYIRAGMSRRDVSDNATNRETREIRFCKADMSIEEQKNFNGFIFMYFTKRV
jgi:hypothetical protein